MYWYDASIEPGITSPFKCRYFGWMYHCSG